MQANNRHTILTTIRQNPHISVLIIGAGINGIGTFWDLALQNVDVLLIDRADFCSGASAASSHMIHGGIRYLENGEFRLVREAVQERNRLLQNAPHYVQPLPTVIPIFKRFSGLFNAPLKLLRLRQKPNQRGALVVKSGLMMYDAYAKEQGVLPGHQFASRQESLQKFPHLNPDIVSTATYFDAMMPAPERICIDLLRDAQAASEHARAMNYVSVGRAQSDQVMLTDEVSQESFSIKPKLVINATGAWIDLVNAAMGRQTAFIGGTKGSHLVLNHPELRSAIGEHEFFFENEDGRMVLIYPFLHRVMVGTSDIYIDDPDDARCTEEEVDYFLAMIKQVFPDIHVDRSHIVFRFSGVRPLPAAHSNNTGQISRDHSIQVIEPDQDIHFPIYNLIGGKWTTFRAFAEQTADKALDYLGKARRHSTADLPIGGGKDYPQDKDMVWRWTHKLAQDFNMPHNRMRLLIERYGSLAQEIVPFLKEGIDVPLRYKPDYSQREIAYLAKHEHVVHLDDLILRRTLLGILGEASANLIVELAHIVAQTAGWNSIQRQEEIERTIGILVEKHGVSFY